MQIIFVCYQHNQLTYKNALPYRPAGRSIDHEGVREASYPPVLVELYNSILDRAILALLLI